MTVFIVRRLLYACLTFAGITVVTFILIHSVPGDPIDFYLSQTGFSRVSPAVIQAVRAEHHLDDPLPLQYWYWLRGAAVFDFGRSFVDRRPVMERILGRLPNTIQLNLISFAVAALIGIPIGLWSAARSGRTLERATAVGFFLLYSLPTFWVALLLMRYLSVEMRFLPLMGMVSDDYATLSVGGKIADRLQHLVLPVTTLAYAQIAIFARFSKSALTEVIRQDFITTARAKGVGQAGVLWRHAFRNALIPLITLLGLTIPMMLSGSVIVEQIFQWDGIGRLYLESILRRDYPTVLALTIITAVATLLASLIADILYAIADPRVRLEDSRS